MCVCVCVRVCVYVYIHIYIHIYIYHRYITILASFMHHSTLEDKDEDAFRRNFGNHWPSDAASLPQLHRCEDNRQRLSRGLHCIRPHANITIPPSRRVGGRRASDPFQRS